MEKKLLLLGLLLSHGMHGYQLNENLQHNPGTPNTLKKSNAYKLLNDMEKDGWVTHIQEQEGNRPLPPYCMNTLTMGMDKWSSKQLISTLRCILGIITNT